MPNKLTRLWQEIKRRNVHRSLAVYAGTVYAIFEASSMIFPRWGLTDWTLGVVLYLLIAGPFITFIIFRIYDFTPEGVQKTTALEEVTREDKTKVSISRKLEALTNMSPVEFITNMRLKRASTLLKQHYGNVSEVALEVGFSNPSYFTQVFKKAFSVTPARYAKS